MSQFKKIKKNCNKVLLSTENENESFEINVIKKIDMKPFEYTNKIFKLPEEPEIENLQENDNKVINYENKENWFFLEKIEEEIEFKTQSKRAKTIHQKKSNKKLFSSHCQNDFKI